MFVNISQFLLLLPFRVTVCPKKTDNRARKHPLFTFVRSRILNRVCCFPDQLTNSTLSRSPSCMFCVAKYPLTYRRFYVTMDVTKQKGYGRRGFSQSLPAEGTLLLNTDSFKRGTVDLAVLSVLREKDMYGYEIVKAVSEKSGGQFELPLGTLYPVLYRFVENGYLSDRDEIVNKRLRKYYHLEESGKEYFLALLEEYRKISAGINLIIGTVNRDDENQ